MALLRPLGTAVLLWNLLFLCITVLQNAADSTVGSRWQQPRRSSDYKSWLKARHATGRHGHQSARPCFICPGSSVLSLDSELYHHANNVVDSGHKFAVLMPEPIVRPCLYANQQQSTQQSVTTQVVRGPQPGTPLSRGLHRIVLRVVYQDETNDLTESSPFHHPHKQHAYCRYTIKVIGSPDEDEEREELQLCRAPPSPDHGKVTCKSVGDDVTVMSCRYSCDEGYVKPRSERHLLVQDWNCLNNNSQTPSCIKFEAPVPFDSAQCSGLNLTVAESDDVQLPLPRFVQPFKQESAKPSGAIRIDCDVNSVKAPSKAQLSDANGAAVIVKRHCVARNAETDAAFNCTYDVQLNVDPAPERSMMLAELRFQIGQMSSAVSVQNDPTSFWCDDDDLVERLMRTAKDRLVASNNEACRIANCTKFTTKCLHSFKENRINNPSEDMGERESLLDVTWTVTADYKPFSYEDYFYEGAEVPEGEMLIEKIKAETEAMIEGDLGLRREIETAGGRLLYQSFRLAKLDLICPLHGYVVNASTNQCQKCPENSYQLKGLCQPCPEGTYQDRPGQTECWPCSKRPSNSSTHYAIRCQKRVKEFAGHHPALAVLLANKHLIRNKSLSNKSGKVNNRPAFSRKLGLVASTASSSKYQVKSSNHASRYSKKNNRKPFTSKSRRHLPEYYSATGKTATLKERKPEQNATSEDPCWPNPCVAGGTCLRTSRFDENNDFVQNFKCACRPGATGVHCETPYCPALYCFNGGTCVINHQRFGPGPESRELVSCECPPGFTGRRCEHRLRRLTSKPNEIRHHRRRQHQPKALNERLDAAPVNNSKENRTDMMGVHCSPNPCRNGGRCVDNSHATPSFFTCICPPKYQGELCDYAPCPASVGRALCPRQLDDDTPYPTVKGSSRKRNQQCLIHTPTGRRQCMSVSSRVKQDETL